ncbi:PREDICTED: uncharacterized protein LOC106148760, partial [Chinchilla lanigera]|uniref:uncharacterized protein LOC106148760 n=1 Tax=Chinchilla lanigera TaxID=34839 RepID=UPI000695FB7E
AARPARLPAAARSRPRTRAGSRPRRRRRLQAVGGASGWWAGPERRGEDWSRILPLPPFSGYPPLPPTHKYTFSFPCPQRFLHRLDFKVLAKSVTFSTWSSIENRGRGSPRQAPFILHSTGCRFCDPSSNGGTEDFLQSTCSSLAHVRMLVSGQTKRMQPYLWNSEPPSYHSSKNSVSHWIYHHSFMSMVITQGWEIIWRTCQVEPLRKSRGTQSRSLIPSAGCRQKNNSLIRENCSCLFHSPAWKPEAFEIIL